MKISKLVDFDKQLESAIDISTSNFCMICDVALVRIRRFSLRNMGESRCRGISSHLPHQKSLDEVTGHAPSLEDPSLESSPSNAPTHTRFAQRRSTLAVAAARPRTCSRGASPSESAGTQRAGPCAAAGQAEFGISESGAELRDGCASRPAGRIISALACSDGQPSESPRVSPEAAGAAGLRAG